MSDASGRDAARRRFSASAVVLAFVLLASGPACRASSPPVDSPAATPAIPEAWGHGAYVQGARSCRNPRILVVDSLEDEEANGCGRGACTLREATESECAFVVFNVSGWIDARDREARGDFIQIGESVTVFGQTSPKGIGLRGGFQISDVRGDGVRNVVLSHLRARPGSSHDPDHLVQGCNERVPAPLGQGHVQICEGRCARSGSACLADEECGGRGPCLVPSGRRSCRSSADCGGGSCRAFRRIEKAPSGQSCPRCRHWERRRPFDLDDWSGCNDPFLRNASIKDSLAIVSADEVFVDHFSGQWCADEALSIVRYERATPMSEITVQRSILGACNDAQLERHGEPAGPEHPAGYPILISGKRPIEGVSLIRNYLLHGYKRCPKVGSVTMLYLQNVHYNCRTFFQLQPTHHPRGVIASIDQNVFVEGPSVAESRNRLHGVCRAASRKGCPRAGAPCIAGKHEPCQVMAPGAIHITPSPKVPNLEQRIHLGSNGYFQRDRSRYSLAGPREFGDEWDWLPPNDLRPRFKRDAGGNYSQRVLATEASAGLRRPEALDPWGTGKAERSPVWNAVRSDVGASANAVDGMPGGRDAIDLEYVRDLERGTGQLGPMGPYRYPSFDDTRRWLDTDSDGVCDGWEVSHFGDVSRSDGLGDADGDGYRDVEEWANGTDPNVSCRTGATCLVSAPAAGCTFGPAS